MASSTLRSELAASHGDLFERLRGLTEEQFRFVPPHEDWSIATHLAHLLRTERLFCDRAAAALREHNPWMPGTGVLNDDDPSRTQHLAVPQIIHGMQAARRELESLLDGCDEAALDRAIIHERLGRMTVRQIAEKMANHEREHAADVARLAKRAQSSRPAVIPLAERPQ